MFFTTLSSIVNHIYIYIFKFCYFICILVYLRFYLLLLKCQIHAILQTCPRRLRKAVWKYCSPSVALVILRTAAEHKSFKVKKQKNNLNCGERLLSFCVFHRHRFRKAVADGCHLLFVRVHLETKESVRNQDPYMRAIAHFDEL